MDAITVQEIRPQLVDDYLRFFDQEAFADNIGWSYCYCAFYDHPNWGQMLPTAEARDHIRAQRADLIRSGKASGLLAYASDKVVGWCNAGLRASCRNPQHIAKAMDDGAESVGSLRCFIV